jgi:hypothetical protein
VPIPQKALEQNPELVAFQNTDFFRRANLASEMMTIVEDGQSITKRESMRNGEVIQWFGWLEPGDLKTVYRYLLARARHEEFNLKDRIKMAWIGFRGHDKFDEPDLMGMEVRAIGRTADMDIIEPFLNTLQKSWMDQELGISKDKLQLWLESQHANRPFQALEGTWYHRRWADVLENASPEIQKRFSQLSIAERQLFYETTPEETKLLFQDWSTDPIFIEATPAQLQLLKREQASALDTLSAGKKAYRQVVRNFLIKSGLYEAVLKSLRPNSTL